MTTTGWTKTDRFLQANAILLTVVLTTGAGSAKEPMLDGASAALWKPCLTWTRNHPTQYRLLNEAGVLVFTATGANTEMPWIVDLRSLGLSGDQRYLLVPYKAAGVSVRPGAYFLHGEEGTHGGKTYALADALKADDAWHTVAVDLVPLELLDTTHHLALKIAVGDSGSARLAIERIWFADRLPADADADLARPPPRARPGLNNLSPPPTATCITKPACNRPTAATSSRPSA